MHQIGLSDRAKVNDVTFSRDGALLASASADKSIKAWLFGGHSIVMPYLCLFAITYTAYDYSQLWIWCSYEVRMGVMWLSLQMWKPRVRNMHNPRKSTSVCSRSGCMKLIGLQICSDMSNRLAAFQVFSWKWIKACSLTSDFCWTLMCKRTVSDMIYPYISHNPQPACFSCFLRSQLR